MRMIKRNTELWFGDFDQLQVLVEVDFNLSYWQVESWRITEVRWYHGDNESDNLNSKVPPSIFHPERGSWMYEWLVGLISKKRPYGWAVCPLTFMQESLSNTLFAVGYRADKPY